RTGPPFHAYGVRVLVGAPIASAARARPHQVDGGPPAARLAGAPIQWADAIARTTTCGIVRNRRRRIVGSRRAFCPRLCPGLEDHPGQRRLGGRGGHARGWRRLLAPRNLFRRTTPEGSRAGHPPSLIATAVRVRAQILGYSEDVTIQSERSGLADRGQAI